METTKQTAHVAEALKNLHEATAHVLNAYAEQMNGQIDEAADERLQRDWAPLVQQAEAYLKKLLAETISENAMDAAVRHEPKWAV